MALLVDLTVERGGRLSLADVSAGRVAFSAPPTETFPANAVTAGETLAVGQDDGSIALRDLESRRRVAVLQPDRPVTGQTRRPGHYVDSLAFDRAGEQLASVSGGTITVWDVPKREAGATLRWGGRGQVRFSPDGQLLADAGVPDAPHGPQRRTVARRLAVA